MHPKRNSMSDKTRLAQFDLIKTIAIIFVCCCHWPMGYPMSVPKELSFDALWSPFLIGIESSCIPLFFMASGALMLNHPVDPQKNIKRLTHLFFQFMIWSAITIVSLRLMIPDKDAPTLSSFRWILAVLFNYDHGLYTIHLWFMPVFLGVTFIAPFLQSFFFSDEKGRDIYLYFSLILLYILYIFNYDIQVLQSGGHLVSSYTPDIAWQLYYLPFARIPGAMVFYFILGGLLHRKREHIAKLPFILPVLTLILGMSLLCAEWAAYTMGKGLVWNNVGLAYYTTPTVIISVSVFILAGKITSLSSYHNTHFVKKMIGMIGANTIGIYYIHYIIGSLFSAYILPGIDISYYSPLTNLVKALILVIISLLIYLPIKKIPVL